MVSNHSVYQVKDEFGPKSEMPQLMWHFVACSLWWFESGLRHFSCWYHTAHWKTFGPSSACWDLSNQWNIHTLFCMIKMVSLVTSWIRSPDHCLMSDFWGFVLCKFASLSIKPFLFHYSSYDSFKCTFHLSQLCSMRNNGFYTDLFNFISQWPFKYLSLWCYEAPLSLWVIGLV